MATPAADNHGPLAQSLPQLRTAPAPESAAPTQHAQKSCKRNSLHVTELSQSPQQQRTVSAFNAASKDSDDHISIVVSELERAAAKGKEGSKDITTMVGEEPSADSCSCGAGWLLFSLGWVFFVPFVIGALLPVFDPSQRKVPHKRSAWIANMVLAVTYAIVGAVIIVLACNGTLHSQQAAAAPIAGDAGATDGTIFKGSTNSVIGPGF